MFIETQETPNPNTLKFLPGRPVLEKGVIEFKRDDPIIERSPLAALLFSIEGVVSVFLAQDFISVSKEASLNWDLLKIDVLEALMDFFMSDQPVMNQPFSTDETESENEIVRQINALLDQAIRPALARDGGNVTFHTFDEETGIVYLEMIGACAGCPSAAITLKMGIERALKHHIPEVKEVRAA